jgi:hypothetical protein
MQVWLESDANRGTPAICGPLLRAHFLIGSPSPSEVSASCSSTAAGDDNLGSDHDGVGVVVPALTAGPDRPVCSTVNRWIASVSTSICLERSSSCSFCCSSS